MPEWRVLTNTLKNKEKITPLLGAGGSCQLLEDSLVSSKNTIGVLLTNATQALVNQYSLDPSLLIIADKELESVDIVLPENLTLTHWRQACGILTKLALQKIELQQQQRLNHDLTNIGIALSAEKELPRLLNMIVEEGRKLANCEAASLYLVDHKETDKPVLKFMLFQNEKLDVPFKEKRYPLDHRSMAGHTALTGKILNIPDVYNIKPTEPYVFDDGFDKAYQYRTREVLTIPMKNRSDEIIGILQFLNLKNESKQFKSFDSETCERLLALASQSAVAIDNSLLIENIRDLFEGFVSAAVNAIEARDPITSGHSFRVAEYTCGIAEKLERHPSLNQQALTVQAMRELRYAALLHDFGKVGVREHILQKAKKLSPIEIEMIRLRLSWFQQKLKADFYQFAYQNTLSNSQQANDLIEQQHESYKQQCKQIELYLNIVEEANEPSILGSDHYSQLKKLKDFKVSLGDEEQFLLSDQEFLSLSVTRGSLTEGERQEIQSHVNHTFDFLKRIPWTKDLQNIPFIASAHHEKLDGSGYPFGLTEKDIPIQTRMMTIADIYDALTASDRPYKSALSQDRALSILTNEANEGKLDSELVQLFIDAGIYKLAS